MKRLSFIKYVFADISVVLLAISIFQFLRPQENMKFIHGGHFEFQ